MSKHLVLVSHGQFCEGLKQSTEMIMGPQDHIHTVSLLSAEGPEEFQSKFLTVVEELEDFVVFADLLGGTPCNVVASLILGGKEFDLYAGMNMPMVIRFINDSLLGTDSRYDESTSEYVQYVNDVLKGMMADDEED